MLSQNQARLFKEGERHGTNVNHTCKRSGSTPLHRAVTTSGAPGTAGRASETREIIKLLLEAGADPAIKNKTGKKPADDVPDPRSSPCSRDRESSLTGPDDHTGVATTSGCSAPGPGALAIWPT